MEQKFVFLGPNSHHVQNYFNMFSVQYLIQCSYNTQVLLHIKINHGWGRFNRWKAAELLHYLFKRIHIPFHFLASVLLKGGVQIWSSQGWREANTTSHMGLPCLLATAIFKEASSKMFSSPSTAKNLGNDGGRSEGSHTILQLFQLESCSFRDKIVPFCLSKWHRWLWNCNYPKFFSVGLNNQAKF